MAANVTLSGEELKLVGDPAWILTKNSIIRKVVEMFGELSGEFREILASGTDPKIATETDPKISPQSDPKISRGEQYKGLPWVMLDYPRVFGREDVLAVRTFFWWGHCFSVTLHLKGKYLRSYLPVIKARWGVLERAGFSAGVAEDEWEHEHTPGEWGADRSFLKLAATIGFDKWNEAPELLKEKFKVIAGILVT